MQDLAETALNVALQLGASYADVRVMERFTEAIQVKNDRVEGVASGEEIGLNVRVLFEGAWGFASSARLDVRAAQQTAALAVRIAKASALVSGRPVDLSPLPPQRGVYATPIGRDPFAVPIDQKVDVLLRACAAMQAVKGVTIASGQMAYGREHKIFASSQGSSIEQTLYDTGAGIEAAAMAEGEVQVRSYPNSSMQVGSAGYELIEALDLVGNAPRVAEEAVQLLSAKQCPSDVITTVVLDGPQTALQIHESCGHPIELDRVLGMEAGFVGKSFLTLDKLGTFRYGSDVVTIVADATTPGGLGTFGWDDEGVPAQSTDIVKDGRFVGYLMSRDTAPLLGLASNGCVRADGWNRLPMIRMTNVSVHQPILEHRRPAPQFPVRHGDRLGDQTRQARRHDQESYLYRDHARVLGRLRRRLRSRALDGMGHAELWQGRTDPGDAHGARRRAGALPQCARGRGQMGRVRG